MNRINPNNKPTIGIEMECFTFPNCQLQIWDTGCHTKYSFKQILITHLCVGGQEEFNSITNQYLRDSHCVIFVYDITKKKSFERVEYYKRTFEEVNPSDRKCLFILAGTKLDLVWKGLDNRQVTTEEARNLLNKLGGDR
jgi:GTPase SAR1 family protein